MIWNLEPDENGVRHTPLHLPCTGDEPRNPVTVDWVSEVMCRLFMNPEAHGGTYNITPDVPMTARQLIDYTGTYFNCTGVVYDAREIGVNEFDSVSHEHLSIYHDYLTTDPQFDRTNMLKFVPDLPSPRIDEAMIHRFLRYGDSDRWGKRRQPAPEVPFRSRELLQAVVTNRCPTEDALPQRTIGLDAVGPGGGQFSISLIGDECISIDDGLPPAAVPIVRVTTAELANELGLQPADGGSEVTADARAVGTRLVQFLAGAGGENQRCASTCDHASSSQQNDFPQRHELQGAAKE
jgi:hypothetical protein